MPGEGGHEGSEPPVPTRHELYGSNATPLYQIRKIQEVGGAIVYRVQHCGGHIGARATLEGARQYVREHYANRERFLDAENYDIIEGHFTCWK